MCQIMPREAFITVGGMDERFRGWGGEDRAFLMALDHLWGPHQNLPGQILHLWHPRIIAGEGVDTKGKRAEVRAWTGQKELRSNDWLSKMYDSAAGNKEDMYHLVWDDKKKTWRERIHDFFHGPYERGRRPINIEIEGE